MSSILQRCCAAGAVLVSAVIAAPAPAAADFEETFNDASGTGWSETGPANLIAEGWIFRNQTEPSGVSPAWSPDDWDPREGAKNLRSSSLMQQSPDGYYDVSNWAILPAVPGQAGGDFVTLFAQGWTGEPYTHAIEIRYSPGGGTSTGSSSADLGDFTSSC